jgi:hypothetical protein
MNRERAPIIIIIFTFYLIDFYNIENKIKDSRSLYKVIKYLLYKEIVDIIIFVGKLSFSQFLLFRVPLKYKPKKLYFIADILIPDLYERKLEIYNILNWDFGLFNYDVR